MQFTGRNGDTIASGTATKDAEYKTVGEHNTPVVSFSLAVNARGTDGAYANCKAFGDRLAEVARIIKKGDKVFVSGHIESREYNGKTYTDTNCDFVSVIGESGVSNAPPASHAEQNHASENKPEPAQTFDDDPEDDECIFG